MFIEKEKYNELVKDFQEFKDKKEDLIEIEVSKANKIREEILKAKREIEYKDEQSRLTYHYHEKLREQTANVYAKHRKAEIMNTLITEGIDLLQSKINEEENKFKNIDSMVNSVEEKVVDLLQKEKEFFNETAKGNF